MMDSGYHDTLGLTRLAETVNALAERVAELESRLGVAATKGAVLPTDTDATGAGIDEAGGTAAPTAEPLAPSLGFAVLMIAGAFLLRAFTESGVLAGSAGLVLGLVYALWLLWPTQRAAASGRRTRATLFGLAGVLVAFPLVWETSTRLGLLPPPGAAGAVVLITAAGLALALRYGLGGLAWTFLLAALTTLCGLFWTAGAPTLFAGVVLALGAATVWLGDRFDWTGPRWLAASVTNLLILLMIALAHPSTGSTARLPHPDPVGAVAIALALVGIYLGGFILRTLVQGREAGGFEVAQSLGCLLFGYPGAVILLRADGGGATALGWTTLVVAVVGYGAAFMHVRQRQGRGLSFFYHAWLGLLLTLLGSALIVPAGGLPWLWSGLAMAVALAGGRYDRWTLRLHCAAYLICATALTGLPAAVLDAFAAPAGGDWRGLARPGIAAWTASLVCYGLLVATHRRCELSPWRRLPRFLIAAIGLAGAGALLIDFLIDGPARRVSGSDAAVVAAVRTLVLAGTTMLLAVAARRRTIVELSWFVTPLLVLGGLKLLLEDMRRGTPPSLFLGFAVFGTALIVASRLRRMDHPEDIPPQPKPGGDLPDTAPGETHGA